MIAARLLASSLLFLLLGAASVAHAETYYVSNAGDDANDGLGPSSAWRTVGHVNAATLAPGDTILFNRGDTFAETIVPQQSGTAGNVITYGAYGSGAKPLFTGFSTVSTWTSVGANRWRGSVSGAPTHVSSVLIGGVVQPLGRYPRADAPNSGYLTIASHSSGNNSITDPTLPSSPDFTGAEVFIRLYHWQSYRASITSHVGSTLTFPAVPDSAIQDQFGYFIENHPATLAANGDWYYDAAAGTLGMYFEREPPPAQVSARARLVSIDTKRYLVFSELALEGANEEAFYAYSSEFIDVLNCDIAFAGTFAVRMRSTYDVRIDGNVVHDSLSEGVYVEGNRAPDNVAVTNNVILSTGAIAGMSQRGSAGFSNAVVVRVSSGASIERNTITNTGYGPIGFYGNDILVRNNVIDRFCTVLDDGGAIYTWNGPRAPLSNRRVIGNVISNGVGSANGTPVPSFTQCNGIYLDNNSNHVEVANNTVYRVADHGLHMNSPQDVSVHDNNFFDNGRGWSAARWVNDGSSGMSTGQDLVGLDIHDNAFVSRDESESSFRYVDYGVNFPATSTLYDRLNVVGTVNHNFYYSPNPMPVALFYRADRSSPYVFPPDQSIAQWRVTSGLETESTVLTPYPIYTINSLLGSNLYPGGDFESGLGSVYSYSNPLNHDVALDETSRLGGVGSIRVSFPSPSTSVNDSVSLLSAMGPISSLKKYVLRVSTLGATEYGTLRVSLRQAEWGSTLALRQQRPFGTTRVDHEFLFEAPTSDAAAAWQIDVMTASGTTYLDDISFYEVDATRSNPDDYVRFEVNSTDVESTIFLADSYTDVRGTNYCGPTTLQPFASIVLFHNDAPCTATMLDGGIAVDAGADGSVLNDGAILNDAGMTADTATSADGSAGSPPPGLAGGCACNVGASSPASGPSTWLGWCCALLVAFVVRRRRLMNVDRV